MNDESMKFKLLFAVLMCAMIAYMTETCLRVIEIKIMDKMLDQSQSAFTIEEIETGSI